MDSSEREWGTRLLEIVDALTNRNKPLVWTLSLPSAAQRKKLNDAFFPHQPLASHRYRYAEVFSNGKQRTERKPIDSVSETVLARGDIADRDLELHFFEFSENTDPAAELRYRGMWAILCIYLMQGGYYDPEKKILYAPLIVRDKYDASSVLWVALQFNKQIPQPSDWPSTLNWPEFSTIQKTVRHQRAFSVTSWSELIMNCRDYEELKKRLLNYDLAHYPLLEISMSTPPESTAFFRRNRYAELVIPGKRPMRTVIGPGLRLLGRVELTCPLLKLRFYKHANDTTPTAEVEIPGPYAPLHLLTAKHRSWKDSSFQTEYELVINSEKVSIPFVLHLIE